MTDKKLITLSLNFKDTSPLEGTKEETIQAINSVPGIRNKAKIIEGLPDSARFIKGYPVLKEGTFNRMFFPRDVLERDAHTWMEHEKEGMTRKVKLNHGSGVEGRVAHLTNSYFDDDLVKTDFLILDQKAIEKWDQGFLDDPSITAVPKFDLTASRKSTPANLVIKSLRGTGFDFVDRPACKTCGIDSILAELDDEVARNSLNNTEPPQTDEVDLVLEEETMEDNQTHQFGEVLYYSMSF